LDLNHPSENDQVSMIIKNFRPSQHLEFQFKYIHAITGCRHVGGGRNTNG